MRLASPIELNEQLIDLRKKGFVRGVNIGFSQMHQYFTMLRGTTTYFGGLSSHGKTYLILNILRNLTDFHGWRHAIFSPETGDSARLMAKLLHIHAGKPFFELTEGEIYGLTTRLEQHYRIMEMEDDELILDNFILLGKQAVGEGFDTVTLDPFNELRHRFDKHGGREDKYLEDKLTEIRRVCMATNTCWLIAAHARSDKSSMRGSHPKPPSMYEFSGGEAFANKAMNVVCVYRPAEDDGRLFPAHNRSVIFYQKIKPEEVGERGESDLYYDKQSGRFYEKDPTAGSIFARNPNKEPIHTNNGQGDEVPF